jgi:hypothetical protein
MKRRSTIQPLGTRTTPDGITSIATDAGKLSLTSLERACTVHLAASAPELERSNEILRRFSNADSSATGKRLTFSLSRE